MKSFLQIENLTKSFGDRVLFSDVTLGIYEANTTSKSMKKFKELFPDKVKLRIRFSLDNLKLDDDVLNIPLFMADQADRLIGLALEKSEH